MKTVLNVKTLEVRRVPNEVAAVMIASNNNWEYCPKHIWKSVVRDVPAK